MKTVAVIDYGMSNLRSVSKALEYVADNKWQIQVVNHPQDVVQADKVVFPGQGAIGNCMALLKQSGLDEAIRQALVNKPFLGICLGMQTLLTASEESGGTAGFDVIAGIVKRFPEPSYDSKTGERLKIPHMGWNQVAACYQHPLWSKIPENSWFYFVHSYCAVPQNLAVIAGKTIYGDVQFTSAIANENVFAIQFHPEKSQHAGLQLLTNFLAW